MKKLLLLSAALIIAVLSANAQEKKAYETTANFDKKISGECISVEVMATVKDAQKLMVDLMKNNYQLKGKSSGKTIKYEKIAFPEISTDYINMMVSFEEKSKSKENPLTKINVFIQKGIATTFESAKTDAEMINKLKLFLDTKYYDEVYKHNLQLRIDMKNKEIKETEKEIETINKDIEKRGKDIEGYKKDIQKANDNINKANGDIESSKKKLEETKAKLAQQNAELKAIK